MTERESASRITVEVLEEDVELSLGEFCRICRIPADRVVELIDLGVIEVSGQQPHWRFHGVSVKRVHRAIRLQNDLGVNDAGMALALICSTNCSICAGACSDSRTNSVTAQVRPCLPVVGRQPTIFQLPSP